MQFMQSIKEKMFSRRGIALQITAIAAMALFAVFAPQNGSIPTLAENCENPPQTAMLNYWPVTYDDENTPFCHDFPAIDAAVDTSNPQFSQSEADWTNGLTLASGQQGVALMYIHNGATNNLDPELTKARNVRITTVTDTAVGTEHQINVTFTSDNTNTVNKSFTVHTPANSKLEVISNSGVMYAFDGTPILDQQNLNLGNSTYVLGDLDSCFEYSLFLAFKFKVVTVAEQNTTLSIEKKVKNLTDNTAYADSVNADQNDRVGYRITVKNTGTATAKTVTMTDESVSGISVDADSTVVSNPSNTNADSSLWQGAVPGTVNLGDLAPGEERVITYTGKVTASSGTLTNTAYAQASNASRVQDSASVVVTKVIIGKGKLQIEKVVKNENQNTSYADSVNARTGEWVTFKVIVTNTGDEDVKDVVMKDILPDGLDLDKTSIDREFRQNDTVTVNIGTLAPNKSKTITFSAQVLATGERTICNTASATGRDVNKVSDDACVKIIVTSKPTPTKPHIVISKTAFNNTKNADATTVNAAREDYITYKLITKNDGDATARDYVISDDLSQVLPLADMVDLNGGKLNGNTITYPATDIKPGETVVKTFRVRVKNSLASNLSYQLRNTYGNTVVINVPGKVVFEAPKTGSAGTSAAVFAGLVTAGFVAVRKRDSILKFIFA